ncbi:hypothetical protein [Staphylococcus phage PT94]
MFYINTLITTIHCTIETYKITNHITYINI